MLGRQLRQHRHQTLVERRCVQIGHQHHQRAPTNAALHGGHDRGGVRFDQRGLQRRHRVDQLGEQFGAGGIEHARPADPVVGEEVDVVAGPRCQRRQQQRRVHRPVQPRPAAGVRGGGVDADAARRRAAGVEHDDHPAVAFGPPGAHHDVGAARGGAPVDGPDVVTDDVLAQRVELGALATDQHGHHAVELPQLGQPRRQMLTRQERRQDADLPRHPMGALPARKAERSDRARGDHRRLLVAPADRPQHRSPTRIRWPAAISSAWVRGSARALGGHASRTWPRNRRRPAFSIVSSASTGLAQPRRGLPEPDETQPTGSWRPTRRRPPPPPPAGRAARRKPLQARVIARSAARRSAPPGRHGR